jgi:hypothetical protein
LVAAMLSTPSPNALADKVTPAETAAAAKEFSPRRPTKLPTTASPARPTTLEPPSFSDNAASRDGGVASVVEPAPAHAPIASTASERRVFAVPLKVEPVPEADPPPRAAEPKESPPVRPSAPSAASAPERRPPPSTNGPDGPDGGADPEVDVLTLIRLEIKQRLPSFQACAKWARRRGGGDVRRVQATWAIAADGAIKKIELDGVDDPQLAACLVRAGSRRFAVQPGVDLVVPTPIVFVITPSESAEP